jgi:hypothetical protein
MPMRVCLVSSEVAPFAKTGGLGDVAAALARYLKKHGHDARLFLPLYGSKPSGQAFVPVSFLQEVRSPWGPGYTYPSSRRSPGDRLLGRRRLPPPRARYH